MTWSIRVDRGSEGNSNRWSGDAEESYQGMPRMRCISGYETWGESILDIIS